jgi:hypothetical protein
VVVPGVPTAALRRPPDGDPGVPPPTTPASFAATRSFNYDPPSSGGMSELKSCYFCGDIGDGLTGTAVVPDRFDPDAATQRTLVLCPTCRRKFDAAVEPLVSLLDAEGATAAATGRGETTETDREGSGEAPDTHDDTGVTIDPGAEASRAERADELPTFETPGGDVGDATEREAGRAAADPETTPDASSPGTTAPTDADPDDASVSREPNVSTDTGGSDESDGSDEETSPATGTGTAAGPTGDPPAGFRRVVRLLQNRDFPVQRAAFVELASGAYELDPEAVETALDRLVERGALVAEGDELRKP